MRSAILLLFIVATLTNCQDTPKSDSHTISNEQNTTSNTNKTEQIRGLLSIHAGNALLVDQINNAAYPIVDRTNMLDSAYSAAAAPCQYTAENVYAVLTGKFTGKDRMLPSPFEVSQIDTMAAKSPANLAILRVPFEFWCHGNEPFWSIQINNFEGGIFYENVSDNTAWFCPWVAPKASGGTWIYDIPATKGLNEAIILKIKKEKCNDGMSEQTYDYSVVATIKGTQYKGVAIRGGGRLPE